MLQDYMKRPEAEAAAVEGHQILPQDGVEVQATAIRAASLVDSSRTWSLMAMKWFSCVLK